MSLKLRSSKEEFEGRTLEEAISKAQKKYPDKTNVRCFRVRRGGVYGFFARETFIASFEDHVASGQRILDLKSEMAKEEEFLNAVEKNKIEFREQFSLHPTTVEPTNKYPGGVSLEQLVEATKDEVDYSNAAALEKGFPDLLAEAELVLSRSSEGVIATANGGNNETANGGNNETANGGNNETAKMQRYAEQPMADIKQPAATLGMQIAQMGIPREIVGDDKLSSLDSLFGAFYNMPRPKTPDPEKDNVILVISCGMNLQSKKNTAKMLGTDPEDIAEASLSGLDRLRVTVKAKQGKKAVFTLNVFLGDERSEEVNTWIRSMHADYVLGVVPATSKRADIADWLAKIDEIDALNVVKLEKTATPGELLGVAPIAFIDGEKASPHQWMIAILRAISRGQNVRA